MYDYLNILKNVNILNINHLYMLIINNLNLICMVIYNILIQLYFHKYFLMYKIDLFYNQDFLNLLYYNLSNMLNINMFHQLICMNIMLLGKDIISIHIILVLQ